MISLNQLSINQFKALFGIHFTEKMNGKMEGLQSLSTSCRCNPHCIARQKDNNTICASCYADSQMECFKPMQACFEKNTNLLTAEVIPAENWPILNTLNFRFEAFGDLNNAIQCENYFNLCYKNPSVFFALWTKNPWYIDEAIMEGYKKPDNLIIVYSSVYLNKPAGIDIIKRYPFIDKIFTVYDKTTADALNIDINCGAKSCLSCLACYRKNDVIFINEIKK